jgi:hypothetical protein
MESLKQNLHNPRNVIGFAQIIQDEPGVDLEEIEAKIVEVEDIRPVSTSSPAKPQKSVLDEFDANFGGGLGNKSNGNGLSFSLDSPAPSASFAPSKSNIDGGDNFGTFLDELDVLELDDDVPKSVASKPEVPYAEPRREQSGSQSYLGNSYDFRSPDLQRATQEERARMFVGKVLKDTRTAGLEEIVKEESDSEMAEIISRIEGLKKLLKEQDIDVSIADDIRMGTNKGVAKNALMVLQKKYDNRRFSSLFEDSILAGAHMLESYFDGKDTYFDFTGLAIAVGKKMRRMSYTTSNFVGETMKANEIGSGLRIALELALTVALHSKERKLRKKDNIMGDPKFLTEVSAEDMRKLNEMRD